MERNPFPSQFPGNREKAENKLVALYKCLKGLLDGGGSLAQEESHGFSFHFSMSDS